MRDQHIGAQAHDFPKDIQHEEVSAHDQHNHGEGKEGDHGKKSIVPGVTDHITGRKDMDHAAHPGDKEEEKDGQLVDVQTEIDVKRSGCEEMVERQGNRPPGSKTSRKARTDKPKERPMAGIPTL